MDDSVFEFASSNFISSTPLTVGKDWTLYYTSDSISGSFDIGKIEKQYDDLIKSSVSVTPKIKEIESCETETSSKMEYVFRSPLKYDICFDDETIFVENHALDSKFKNSAQNHEGKLDDGASVFTRDCISDFHGNICFIVENEALHSPCGNAKSERECTNADLKKERNVCVLDENKLTQNKGDEITYSEIFHSKKSNSDDLNNGRQIFPSTLEELVASLQDDNYLPSHAASFSNTYESLEREWSNCDNLLQPQKEQEQSSEIHQKTVTIGIPLESMEFNSETDCCQTFEHLSLVDKTLSKTLSAKSLEKLRVSESTDKDVFDNNQLAYNNHSSFIEGNFNRSAVAPGLESTNEQTFVNSEMHGKCEINTCMENIRTIDMETATKNVIDNNQLANNPSSFIDGNFNRSSVAPGLESTNQKTSVNSEMHDKCEKNTCMENNRIIGLETATESVINNNQLAIDNRSTHIDGNFSRSSVVSGLESIDEQTPLNSKKHSKCEKNKCIENIRIIDIETATETVIENNQLVDGNHSNHINRNFNHSFVVSRLESTNEQTPVNSEMHVKCEKNTSMENIPIMDKETATETVIDFFECTEEAFDVHLKQLSESFFMNHQKQPVKKITTKGTPTNTYENYQEKSNEYIENMDVSCESQTYKPKDYFTEDCSLNTSLVYCIHCEKPCLGYITEDEVKVNDMKNHEGKSSSNAKTLLDLLEVDDPLKCIFLALLEKFMKNGVTQGEILNYLVQDSSPASIFKLKQHMKLALVAAIKAGIIDKKNRRYFLRMSPIAENQLDKNQRNKYASIRKSKYKSGELENRKDLRKMTDMKKTKNDILKRVKSDEGSKSDIQNLRKMTNVNKTKNDILERAKSGAGNKSEIQKNKYVVKRENKTTNNLEKGRKLRKTASTEKTKSYSLRRVKLDVGNELEIQENKYTAKRKSKTESNEADSGKGLLKMTNIKKTKRVIPRRGKAVVENKSENQEQNKNAAKRKNNAITEIKNGIKLPKLTSNKKNAIPLKCKLRNKSEGQKNKRTTKEDKNNELQIENIFCVGKRRSRFATDNQENQNRILPNKSTKSKTNKAVNSRVLNSRKAVNEKCIDKTENVKFPTKRKYTEQVSKTCNKKRKCDK